MNTKTSQTLFSDRTQNVPKSFIREILKVASDPDIVSFAGGLPNPQCFPVKELADCAANVLNKHGMQALQYSATEGYFPLREFIAKRYKQQQNLDISPDQILITNGSQQALDLIAKVFINPGDNIIMERPSYLGALQCFSMYEPHFLEVELNNDGMDTLQLESHLTNYPVKLLYTIPNFQNPTGIQYSTRNREEITQIVNNFETILVEDDPYGDIRFSHAIMPSLYSYLPDQTILLGSFSKTIAPGLRLGWMVANPDIIRKATIMKQASDLQSGNLTQYILYEFLSNYHLETHVAAIRMKYRAQRDSMLKCLHQYFPADVEYTKPEGGMFTWLKLPPALTARKLLEVALQEKIIFVPGDTFYIADPDEYTLRLNFSNVEEKDMEGAMLTIAKLIRSY